MRRRHPGSGCLAGLVAAVLAPLLLSCSTWSTMAGGERSYVVTSIADLASTAYALETCSSCREGNGLLTVTGDETWQVVLTGALLRWGLWAIADRWIPEAQRDKALGAAAVPSGFAAAHNLRITLEDP